MYYTWKMALVSVVSVPLVLGGVFLESRVIGGSSLLEKRALEGATKIAVEAISNVRTVASLCQEKGVLERYTIELNKAAKQSRRRNRLRGLVFAFGQAAPFLAYSLSLYYGGSLVAYDGLEYKNVIKVSEALIFGAWMLGQSLAFAPNINAAKTSAKRIFALFDRNSKIQSLPGFIDTQKIANGRVEFSNIKFHYPTRPDISILKGLDLLIQPGQTVALVGYSGCGKSTCIQLLQRLYDPVHGSVTLDDNDISTSLSLGDLRSQLGIVSQEPVLFDRTIAENIAYGDNSRVVPMNEIIEAAKKANVHGFVSNMPLGYETSLGTKGAQLSGGQKQRIAIARALVRNPRILLLDEATSALDANSEKIIQAALDEARCGRTCIIIAHRLDTIRTADVICVLDQGKVVEIGTHEELLAAGGVYTQLHGQQNMLS
uniref:ABC-type xenobiotic transporter n=1 Tax=Xenopsylla cheopis TaxID=163159 RepID=A0A6M2DYA2_XENCH